MSEVLDTLLTMILYLASTFILFFIGKLVYQLFNPKIKVKNELVEKDNLAFAISHAGYFTGLLLAIGSAIIGPSKGFFTDIFELFIYGLLAILLLNIANIINRKVILRKLNVFEEITRDQNSGAGLIEAASSISTGMVILGSVSGEILVDIDTFIGPANSLPFGIFSALVFWLVGQVVLIITSLIYCWVTPYDDLKYIEQDNVAVGIGFAGALIAISNLIRAALMRDFTGWSDSFLWVGIEVVVGLAFLPLARILAEKILLGRSLTDELIHQEKPNVGAGLIEAFSYIGGSVLISWCF